MTRNMLMADTTKKGCQECTGLDQGPSPLVAHFDLAYCMGSPSGPRKRYKRLSNQLSTSGCLFFEAYNLQVSDDFLGVSYNLLSRNCNHFTSALCENLTSRAAPSWLNRAASIGLALPCMVPRDWIDPPDRDSAEGMLLEETYHEDNYQLETSRMLGSRDGQRMALNEDDRFSHTPGEANSIEEGNGKRPSNTRDTSGRALPESERAPTLHEDA